VRAHFHLRSLAASLVLVVTAGTLAAQTPYFPPRGEWARRSPNQVGMDPVKLDEAVAFARASAIDWPTNITQELERRAAREGSGEIVGPVRDWAATGGVIIKNGYIIGEWGDLDRVDMTFSVSKSYLATIAGLAFDRGLIPDLHAPEGELVRDGGFDSPHNAAITWHDHLNQTSEWEGTLWGKPDRADRRRGRDRELQAAGTFWEYNDVRVNRLALSLLRVWGRALPEVLHEEIMDPIGASDTWEWHGYRNSYVDIGGQEVQSVSGGGHWGGGFMASTLDHARFGYLMLRRGKWGDRQLLSERWIKLAETPTDIQPTYGYMWWLNTGGRRYRAAPESSVFALGSGGNMIWIDREHDLLVVTRWMAGSRTNDFIGLVLAAIK